MPHDRKLAVIGLGYVGLPVAVAFARQGTPVIGFDIDAGAHRRAARPDTTARARSSRRPRVTRRSPSPATRRHSRAPTSSSSPCRPRSTRRGGPTSARCSRPHARSAGALKTGDIVVYESTVYPGATEEDCVPVLEAASGLVCGRDFTVGYSPERINPGRHGAPLRDHHEGGGRAGRAHARDRSPASTARW